MFILLLKDLKWAALYKFNKEKRQLSDYAHHSNRMVNFYSTKLDCWRPTMISWRPTGLIYLWKLGLIEVKVEDEKFWTEIKDEVKMGFLFKF
jgi:hypothetical protein